jgi:two-component system chemotaxis response regulator CheY
MNLKILNSDRFSFIQYWLELYTNRKINIKRSESSSHKNHKILIVDNEWNMLKLLYHYLSPFYTLVLKSCPLEAIKWIQDGNQPSLIICEYHLPYFDSASFIQVVKTTGFYHQTPVIILSDADDLEQKLINLPLRVEGMIKKPFNPSHLKSTIQNILNEYEQYEPATHN